MEAMQAIVQDRYGGLEVLELRDIDRPVPKDDEVLVRVHAAGLDRGVWHIITGLPYLIRFVGFGVRRPKVRVRGMDVAGRRRSWSSGRRVESARSRSSWPRRSAPR
jgi:NADPH:quinone reductase-like Zn-dependent oxidoreductase